MARKKRRFEQLEAAASAPQDKKKYNDPIQEKVGRRLEDLGQSLEGKGQTILYALGAFVTVAILIFVFTKWTGRSSAAAQAALGKAIETSQAQIAETPLPATATQKTFKSEKERAEASIAEFQDVADKFSGPVAEKARYFIAVNRLTVDRPAAVADLEGLANGSSETAKLAKFALAQTRVDDNKLDEAIALYQELLAMDDPVVAKDTINFELAKIYEKQDKKQEAADIYFNIAKTASEAKDLDGKPVKMTETATDAKDKLKAIDPARAEQIVVPTPESNAGGGMPISVQPG